jgi:hypothetical protein
MLSKIIRFAIALARQLSDESAYERHLRITGQPSSAAEWKRFTDRHYSKKYRAAKCC